jgi:hypothetical protein
MHSWWRETTKIVRAKNIIITQLLIKQCNFYFAFLDNVSRFAFYFQAFVGDY